MSPAKRRCHRCHRYKPLALFADNLAQPGVKTFWCVECVDQAREIRKKWIQAHDQGVKAYQQLYYAHARADRLKAFRAVRHAIRTGLMRQLHWCQVCGDGILPDSQPEPHHASYEEKHWLDVIWVCREHHKQIHEWIKKRSRLRMPPRL